MFINSKEGRLSCTVKRVESDASDFPFSLLPTELYLKCQGPKKMLCNKYFTLGCNK